MSWELRRGEHLRPAITTLVQVISLPWWPITWIWLACAAGRLQTVCHVEWSLVVKTAEHLEMAAVKEVFDYNSESPKRFVGISEAVYEVKVFQV